MKTLNQQIDMINDLCNHIIACADLWENSGVSRVRTIMRTAEEVQKLAIEIKPPAPDAS